MTPVIGVNPPGPYGQGDRPVKADVTGLSPVGGAQYKGRWHGCIRGPRTPLPTGSVLLQDVVCGCRGGRG